MCNYHQRVQTKIHILYVKPWLHAVQWPNTTFLFYIDFLASLKIAESLMLLYLSHFNLYLKCGILEL